MATKATIKRLRMPNEGPTYFGVEDEDGNQVLHPIQHALIDQVDRHASPSGALDLDAVMNSLIGGELLAEIELEDDDE